MASRAQIEKAVQEIGFDTIMDAAERQMFDLSDTGFCLACYAEMESGCEPDMRDGPCECCGENAVYGAAELVFYL